MTDDALEALAFVIDSLKEAMLVQQQHIEAIEKFLYDEHLFRRGGSYHAPDTAHVGEKFREKWAHMLKEE